MPYRLLRLSLRYICFRYLLLNRSEVIRICLKFSGTCLCKIKNYFLLYNIMLRKFCNGRTYFELCGRLKGKHFETLQRPDFKMSGKQEKVDRTLQPLSDADVAKCCKDPDKSCQQFIMQQTMYRIKNPKPSLEFYTGVLGMRLLDKLDFPEMKFSLYFLGYEKEDDIPKDAKARTEWMFGRKAVIELTHNWGSENNTNVKYHTGNTDPRGFGHIGIMVPDVEAACARFEKMGVKFVKKPTEGQMKNIAFINDPDGYWIEIFNNKKVAELVYS